MAGVQRSKGASPSKRVCKLQRSGPVDMSGSAFRLRWRPQRPGKKLGLARLQSRELGSPFLLWLEYTPKTDGDEMAKECAEQANVRVEIGRNLHSLLAGR